MKMRSTKGALLMSALSLFLCFTMLMGTTFAWFTDSAASNGNIIKSGNLDVGMYWAEGAEDVPTADSGWKNAENGPLFDYDLWEPGYAVARHIKIANEGSLSLRYQLIIEANGEVSELADVIDVYYIDPAEQVNAAALTTENKLGTLAEVLAQVSLTGSGVLVPVGKEGNGYKSTETLTIVLKMQEGAGNEYMGKSIGSSFSIVLVATQMNYELDSFGPDYDKDSVLPGNSASAPLDREDVVLKTEGENPTTVTLPQNIVNDIKTADDTVTAVALKTSLPEIKADADGNVKVVYNSVELVDQDGDEISLEGNTTPIPTTLYVGKDYAGKYATIAHDGVNVATAVVDADGYVTYSTTHFCEVTATITEEAPALTIADLKNEAADPTKLVTVLYGKHYYTMSQGMVNSWTTLTNAEQIVANVYLPEDLIAYAMMTNNGDLQVMNDNGNHSDLTLMANLDYAGYNWIPIGRFYTNIHGNGKTISNLNDSFLGCVYDCQVLDLTLENVNAAGSASGVLGKELAGYMVVSNVKIAGKNTVTYVDDNATNWPEGGVGVGAICGVNLIAYDGVGSLDVTVTGTIDVDYNGIKFGNSSNFANLGVTPELGLNVYMPSQNVTVTLAEGGAINVSGAAYLGEDPLYVTADMLQEAIDNAKDGDTILFVSDLTTTDGVLITDKNITLDLNGYTFTVTSGSNVNNRAIKVNGSSVVTIKNGTIIAEGTINSGAYGSVRTEGSAVVTLENLALYSYRGYGLNVKACTGTKIIINDSAIYAQYSGGVEAVGGEIVLNNTSIIQKGVDSTAAWCSVAIGVSTGGKVTVNSGSYYGAPIATDANAAQGTWVAYVMSSGGNLIINGGTFEGVIGTTASAANACGIICADRAAVVDIYGGTFKSSGAILDMRNNKGTQPNPVATVYGGIFSADPTVSGLYSSNLIKIPEGSDVLTLADGTYTVGKAVGTYAELQDALKAKVGYILLTDDITVTEKWDNRFNGAKTRHAVTIDGAGHTLKIAAEVNDGGNYFTAFRFEAAATVRNLTVDMSKATALNGRLRAISAVTDLTVENCTFIGNTAYVAAKGNAVVVGDSNASAILPGTAVIKSCTFTNWSRGVSDNENAKELEVVRVENCTFNTANAHFSAAEEIVFTGNTMNGSLLNVVSYTSSATTQVTVTGNTLDTALDNRVGSFSAANATVQDGVKYLLLK